ncbi:MAG: PBP1A family penicillin-binding protein [Pseudomonadota bacterium]
MRIGIAILGSLFFSCLFAVLVFINIFLYFSFHLPSVSELEKYTPPGVTEILSSDYETVGKFYVEERYTLPLSKIPFKLIEAFVAAEDANFFIHKGIDPTGILRALIKNVLNKGGLQGGSTITQQVAKTFLLTSERTITRKIKDMILAYRIEKHFSKDHIIYLYLNQIYLGHGYYGVQAAARGYFNKDVSELSLAEMAILAGLPQAPTKLSPAINLDRSKLRQKYVLKRMVEDRYISYEEAIEAFEYPIMVSPKKPMAYDIAPYFIEHIRQYIVRNYGQETLLKGGLTIITTLDIDYQLKASASVKEGLEQLDKTTGFFGPIKNIPIHEIEAQIASSTQSSECSLQDASTLKGIVTQVNDQEGFVIVNVCGNSGKILLEDMRWARKPDTSVFWKEALIKNPSEALSVGDLILVKRVMKEDRNNLYFALDQEVSVQGGLIVIEPDTGYVKSLVGGYDFNKSKFNRVLQAKRQPGSAFKPIIYAAALDKGFTPSTLIIDSPIVYNDAETNNTWKPDNYSEKFYGETTFRRSIVKSLNIPTIKILTDIGIDYVAEYAKKLGIISPITKDLSMALGSSSVTLEELTAAYAVFASEGRKIKPIYIKRIIGPDGEVLETNAIMEFETDIDEKIKFLEDNYLLENEAENAVKLAISKNDERVDKNQKLSENIIHKMEPLDIELPEGYVVSKETAYLMTNLMQAVIADGTGWRAKAIGRPAAGKTGTTNDYYDAWFLGYTPEIVCGVWTGFDDYKSLGKSMTGSGAAAPIWVDFMQQATKGKKITSFRVPYETIDFVRIDKNTGQKAVKDTKDTVMQAFLKGTTPTNTNKSSASGSYEEFNIEDY